MDAAARIAVRPAPPEDAPCLVRIDRWARAVAMPWLGDVRSEAEASLRGYVIPREHVLCAGGEPPLGYIGFGGEGDGWSVHDLHVDPQVQGRGYRSELLRRAMRAAGDAPLRLRRFARNQAARGFYERQGFTMEAEATEPRTRKASRTSLRPASIGHMRGTQS